MSWRQNSIHPDLMSGQYGAKLLKKGDDMKIDIKIKTPKFEDIEIPFKCPNCNKTTKKKQKDLSGHGEN